MPLSDAELEELAHAEGERSEFKESLSDRDRIKRAICAFSNDLADHREPGAIFVGLREDGSCAGLTITEELERMAAAFRSDGSLLPMPSMLMRRERIRGCDVLLIEVEPASAPPVRLSGVAWVRVGSTTRRLPPRRSGALPSECNGSPAHLTCGRLRVACSTISI